jgi:hypothetical protein
MRVKLRLDTMRDIKGFVNTVSAIAEKVHLQDDEGHCVSAKSIMGALYSMEWDNIYCECDRDISGAILKWII